jgi:hypothetical protein
MKPVNWTVKLQSQQTEGEKIGGNKKPGESKTEVVLSFTVLYSSPKIIFFENIHCAEIRYYIESIIFYLEWLGTPLILLKRTVFCKKSCSLYNFGSGYYIGPGTWSL